MGNQESTLAANLEGADEDQEPFDLSAIEDSREYIEEPASTSLHSSSAVNSDMARGRTRSSRMPKSQSEDLEPGESSEQSPLTHVLEPEDVGGLEELRKREPESFGEYDSSEDEELSSAEQPQALNTKLRWDREGKTQGIDRSDSDGPKKPEAVSDQEHDDDGQLSGAAITAQLNATAAETDHIDQPDGDTHSRPKSLRYPCPYADQHSCSRTFSTKKSAQRHAKSHENPSICPVCQKSLARQDSLDRHLERHSDDERNQAQRAAQDKMQDEEAEESGNPVEELEDSHRVDKADVTGDLEEAPEHLAKTRIKRFPCPLADSYSCEKTYETKKGAARHAIIHTSDMSCPLGCIDSNSGSVMLFSTEATRKRHLKNKHDKKEVEAAETVILEQHAKNEEVVADVQDTQLEQTGEDDLDLSPDPSESRAGETPAVVENLVEDGPVMYQDDEPAGDELLEPLIGEVEDPGPVSEATEHSARKRRARELEAPQIGHDDNVTEQDIEMEMQRTSFRLKVDAATNTEDISCKAQGRRKGTENASSSSALESKSSRKKMKQKETPLTSPEPMRRNSKSTPDAVASSSSKPLKAAKASGYGKKRQSTIANFARPYLEGSELRHPLFHPESPQASRAVPYQVAPTLQPTVIIPGNKRRRDDNSDDGQRERQDDHKPHKRRKIRRSAQLVNAKGKERAVSDDEASENEQGGLATSLARKTSFGLSRKSVSTSARFVSEDAESDPALKDNDENDIYTLNQDGPENDAPVSKESRNVMCSICKRKFKNQNRLDIHLASPKSHQNLLDCEECGEQYFHAGQLVEHRKATGHGQGLVGEAISGRFTETEKATIAQWIECFCSEHDLTRSEFNHMMQASFRFGFEWVYDFMTKKEFNAEFYDVLPHRDVRSMRRYREKAFDSGDTSEIWSKREDRMIVNLLEELGPKWRKIGEKLNRPADMCRQRWKNKLQVKDMEHGQWTRVEEAAFLQAVRDVRRASLDSSTTFNWGSVSKLMKTRTPQQCANHWRAKYVGKKKGDKWMSDEDQATQIKMRHMPNLSKMEERLASGPKSSPRKQIISEEYIRESEDENDQNNAPVDDHQEDSQEETSSSFMETKKTKPWAKVSQAMENEAESESENEEDDGEEPELPRNPLTDITPGKTLSASQVFDQTQANTSAKRFSQIKGAQASQERPSPTIAIEHRREQSPELGTPELGTPELGTPELGTPELGTPELGTPELDLPDDQAEDVEEDADDDDDDGETASETDDDKENIPQADGQMDVDINPEQDVQMTDSVPNGILVKHSQIEEDAVEPSSASESESDSRKSDADTESSTSKTHSTSPSASTSQTESNSNSNFESDSDDSSSASTSASASPARPASTPLSTNKKLAEISNSFMDNIYASISARKRNAASKGRGGRTLAGSDDEESE